MGRNYRTVQCIHQLFERQVSLSPDAFALILGERRLTYLEVNRQANQLAHYLRGCGVGPEVPVGVCVERSLEMVIGLLAVLKAGGAYVPLDPTYPNERLAFMLKDSQAPLVLTQQKLVSAFNQHTTASVCLDTDWTMIARESEQDPLPQSTSENLAYIIYTSGSSGHPKGVLISHGALLNHSVNVIKHYELSASDRVLQFASISFDVAAEELFPTLLSGAAVVLLAGQAPPSVSELVELLEEESLTVLNLPASYWHELVLELDHSGKSLSPSLRLVITGSEKVLPDRLRTWRKLFGDRIRWLNAYGPTEATVTATIYEPSEDDRFETVPIGRPMTNRQIHILDPDLNPVPCGVAGELYIGGPGLARGYLNLSDLTAEKFIQDPFDSKPESRLYRTGDSARYLPDGNVEFLGRMDHQVKVRGFRIEPGEIEATIIQHPSVHACAVVPRQDEEGNTSLIAYIAPTGSNHSSPAVSNQTLERVLVRLLHEKLPEHMVPSSVIIVDGLPLTPNGKVDRQALPLVHTPRDESEIEFVSPRDDLELQLVEIWRRVLGIQSIGVNDNFFELGGHSLQAVRMFAEVEKTFGKNIPLTTLFEVATIKQLADILRQRDWSPSESFVVAIQRNGPKPPFFGVHALGGDVLLYRDLARHLGPDQPFYGLRAQRLNGTQLGYASVEEMAQHYIKEIQTIQPKGPYFLGGVSFGGLAAFEMARQLQAQGQEVALLALFDASTPDYVGRELGEFGSRFQYHWNNLKMRSSLGRVEYVLSKAGNVKRNLMRAFRNNDREADHPSLPKHLIELEGKIRQLVEKYVPQVYTGKMTLFRAATQPVGTPSDPMLGWRSVAVGRLEIHEVPGDHRSIMFEPHVRVLAEKLKRCIDKAALMKTNQAVELEHSMLIDQIKVDVQLCFLLSSILVS